MMERLRRHPFLLAYWLAACNTLRNTAQQPRKLWLMAGGLMALASIAVALRHTVVRPPSHAVEQYAAWVAVLAALHAMAVIANGRRLAGSELAQCWLASTPLAAATLPLAVALRTLWSLAWQASLGMLLIIGALAAGLVDWGLAGQLLLLAMIGAGAGGSVGWYLGRARPPAALTQLERVIVPQAVRAPPIDASLQALSGWPIAQVMVWASPKALRWPFIVASLTVPLGFSAIGGVFVIGTWGLLLYMIALLVGVAQVAHDAGYWLRVTPLPLWSFARGLLGGMLLHQLGASLVLAAVLLFAIGGERIGQFTFWTFYLWTAVVITASSIAVAAGRTAKDVRLPLVCAIAALLMSATLAVILAVPLALVCSAWCWRQGLRG